MTEHFPCSEGCGNCFRLEDCEHTECCVCQSYACRSCSETWTSVNVGKKRVRNISVCHECSEVKVRFMDVFSTLLTRYKQLDGSDQNTTYQTIANELKQVCTKKSRFEEWKAKQQ